MRRDVSDRAAPPSVGQHAEILVARNVSKTFGAATVLKDLSLSIAPGEVRGLLGHNGSGKSTLVKIISGVYQPDVGAAVTLNGHDIRFPHSSSEVEAAGLAVMHQDLGLAPSFSVVDNLLINGSASPLRRIRWRSEGARVAEVLKSFGLDIDVRLPVDRLTPSQMAVVALARAFDRLPERRGVLILDEPTAKLELGGAEALFDAVRTVKAQGCGVLFVGHDLAEVREMCDTVTVLRDGRKIEEGRVCDLSHRDLVRAIVGHDLLGQPRQTTKPSGELCLRARGVSGGAVRGLDLDLHRGEIVGLTGLGGMGQDDVPGLLFGAIGLEGGSIDVFGESYQPTPRQALCRGIILTPADRARLAGDAAGTVADNLVMPIANRYFRKGRMRRRAIRADVAEVMAEFDVRPPLPDLSLGALSGGNQQKAILAKWLRLFGDARVALLHEPTQGVDIGARDRIFEIVRQAAADGLSVLFVSSEHEDLAEMCDRVVVMRHGRHAHELPRADCTPDAIAATTLTPAPEGDGGVPRPPAPDG